MPYLGMPRSLDGPPQSRSRSPPSPPRRAPLRSSAAWKNRGPPGQPRSASLWMRLSRRALSAAFRGMAGVKSVRLNDGTTMPEIGYGLYKVGAGEARDLVSQALSAGYRHLDSASFYQNERGVGDAIAASPVPRDELYITTKVWNDCAGAEEARKSVLRSLDNLQCGYLDLVLVHWPHPGHQETYAALEDLQREGLVRSVGVSNYTPEDYAQLKETMRVRPAVNQIEVNPLLYRPDCIAYFQGEGILVQAYKPLRRGAALTDAAVDAIAAKHGATAAQVCLRWGLAKGLVVLPKTATPARLAENLDLYGFELDAEDVAALDALTAEETVAEWAGHLEERRNQDMGAYVTRPAPADA